MLLLLLGVLALPPLSPALPTPALPTAGTFTPALPTAAQQTPEELMLELFGEEDPERLLARADELLKDKRFKEKSRAWLHVYRGQAYQTLKRFEEARTAFDQATELNRDNDTAYTGSASCSMKLLEFAQAVEALREVLRIEPDSAVSRANLGMSYLYLADLTHAREAFSDLKQRDEDSLWGWAGEGLVDAKEGRSFDAWYCLQRAQDLEPEHAWVGSLSVNVAREQVDNEVFRLVVGALGAPGEARLWRAAAARFLELGYPLQALDLARRWQEARPGDREARRYVALHLYGDRFPAEAAAVTRGIVEADPSDLWTGLIRHASLVELDMRGLADESLRGQLASADLDPWLVALARHRLGELTAEDIGALVTGTADADLRAVRALERELFAPRTGVEADPDALVALQILARAERRAKLAPLAQAVVRARPDSAVAALGVARSMTPTWPVLEELHHWLDAVPDGHVVQLPAQVFQIDKQLFFRGRQGLSLRGRTLDNGKPATLIHYSNPSASEPVALFLECADLTLESIQFEHATDEASAGGESVLRLMECDRVNLRNCKLVRGGYGVEARKVTDLVIDGLRIEHMEQAGLRLESVTGISITETDFIECARPWMGDGNAGPFYQQGNMRAPYNVWKPELKDGHCF